MTLQDRVDALHNAIEFKDAGRIPTNSNYWTWMILDAGYKLSEGILDYDKLFDAVTGFHKKYDFDFYNYLGNRNPIRVSNAAGSFLYEIDDDKEIIFVKDHGFMKEDEYPQLIENPDIYQWTVIVNRAATRLHGENADEHFKETVAEMKAYGAATGRIADAFVNDLQVPLASKIRCQSPIELIFSYYRGIRGLSLDLRRRYDLVKEACEKLTVTQGFPGIAQAVQGPRPQEAVFSLETAFLAHSIMNRKQFEEVYWPPVKMVIDGIVAGGNKFNIFCESEFLRFADLLADVPKGAILFEPEEDDIFELRKVLPNIAFGGGMSPDYLGRRTKEECVDYAKKLVEGVGRDGGFVMGQTKMMTYRNDAKPENILAVQEFCRNCK